MEASWPLATRMLNRPTMDPLVWPAEVTALRQAKSWTWRLEKLILHQQILHLNSQKHDCKWKPMFLLIYRVCKHFTTSRRNVSPQSARCLNAVLGSIQLAHWHQQNCSLMCINIVGVQVCKIPSGITASAYYSSSSFTAILARLGCAVAERVCELVQKHLYYAAPNMRLASCIFTWFNLARTWQSEMPNRLFYSSLLLPNLRASWLFVKTLSRSVELGNVTP